MKMTISAIEACDWLRPHEMAALMNPDKESMILIGMQLALARKTLASVEKDADGYCIVCDKHGHHSGYCIFATMPRPSP